MVYFTLQLSFQAQVSKNVIVCFKIYFFSGLNCTFICSKHIKVIFIAT